MLRYQSGNMAAFEQLYRRHKDPLWRFFLRAGSGEALAAEAFQETWAALIKARTTYLPSAKFSTWLYRLAHSKLIDGLRAQKPAQPLDKALELPAPSGAQPEAQAQSAALAARILRSLAALPLEQREAFLLKEEGGLSLDEIAEATGVGRETVKSRLRYALVKLREELADVYP